MRIISKFKDYYDCLQSNDGPVYVRNTSEVKISTDSIDWEIRSNNNNFYAGRGFLDFSLLGFCGEIYPYIYGIFPMPYQDNREGRFYSFLELEEFDNRWSGFEKKLNYAIDYKNKVHTMGFNIPPDISKQYMQFFSPECPVWIITGRGYEDKKAGLIRNPILRDRGLVNKWGVEGTFQSIEMYLSSLALPNKPIPKISDEDMIQAKGFDKFSFRKDKSK